MIKGVDCIHSEVCKLAEDRDKCPCQLCRPRQFNSWPPLSEDIEDIPEIPIWKICHKCHLPAPVVEAGVIQSDDILGYQRYRLRIVVHCRNCGSESIYRMSGRVIKAGSFVKEGRDD